jgi:hypothetical protein
MSGNNLVVIPQNIQLPAHLLNNAELVAQANAAAGGGIKTGGFPRFSIAGSKFFLVDGGEKKLITDPKNPALPLMQLEVVVIGANPRLSKVLYEDDFQPGDADEPMCSSDDGIRPDAHLAEPVFHNCAQCPKNQWGSKISKSSGKEVKACSDVKRLAMLPALDLDFKAAGFTITPSSLGDWGKYVKALSERNIPVTAVVTNLTFDATVSYPKVNFAFGRFLTPEEFAKVTARSSGDDVKQIISPRASAVPALAAPVAQPAAQAAPVATAPVAAPVQEPAKAPRQRRTRAEVPAGVDAAAAAAAAATTAQLGAQAATAQVAAQTTATAIDPLGHLPPEIRVAVQAVGPTSPAGIAILAQYPAQVAAAPVAAPALAPVAVVAANPVEQVAQQAAAATVASFTPPPVATASPATTQAAGGLKALLQAKLNKQAPAA